MQHFPTRALSRLKAWMRPVVHERMLTAVEERMNVCCWGAGITCRLGPGTITRSRGTWAGVTRLETGI